MDYKDDRKFIQSLLILIILLKVVLNILKAYVIDKNYLSSIMNYANLRL